MKFMMMMNAPRGDGDWNVSNWRPEDFQAHIAFMMSFNQQLKADGEFVDGQGLTPPGMAKRVKADANGAPITDGVFPESKEFLAGYWIIDVESAERAYALAAKVSAAPGPQGRPLNMDIELREIMSGPPVDG